LVLKVRTYIALLSVGSLVGATLLIGLGWWGFTNLSEATRALDDETKRTGELSVEYKDVRAFLVTTRNIFVSLEIYPEKYAGLFGVTRDELSLAERQMNEISSKHGNNYPEEILKPIATDLGKLKGTILEMEKNT
jgi:hypothetical protein